jgi:D-xylose transport system permease protein
MVGRQSLTAVIVLGAIWLLNDYRGVPTRAAADAADAGGNVYGYAYRLRSAHYAIGGNIEAARLSGINVDVTSWPYSPLTA